MATSISIRALTKDSIIDVNIFNDGVNESTMDDVAVHYNGQRARVTAFEFSEDE